MAPGTLFSLLGGLVAAGLFFWLTQRAWKARRVRLPSMSYYYSRRSNPGSYYTVLTWYVVLGAAGLWLALRALARL